jgi:hypothetical protein
MARLEYQQNALPHHHILVWLAPEDAERMQLDGVAIRSVVPDSVKDPDLYDSIFNKKLGRHECRPNKCRLLNPNRCSKGYPRPHRQMVDKENQRYQYECYNEFDALIVPFSRYLSLLLKLKRTSSNHSNVLLIFGYFFARYLAKYALKAEPGVLLLPKDYNRLRPTMQNMNDVMKYLMMRVVCFTEMANQLLEAPTVRQWPIALFLDLQLPQNRYRFFTSRFLTAAQKKEAAEKHLADGKIELYYQRPAELGLLTLIRMYELYDAKRIKTRRAIPVRVPPVAAPPAPGAAEIEEEESNSADEDEHEEDEEFDAVAVAAAAVAAARFATDDDGNTGDRNIFRSR